MEYRLAENAEERLAALDLVTSHGASVDGVPGCGSADDLNGIVTVLQTQVNDIAWVVALDGEEIVAAIACRLHPDDTHHLAVLAQGTKPGALTPTVYHNLIVAITRCINWPGCCGNRWLVIMPDNPYVEILDAVAGPIESAPVTGSNLPLLRITGTMDAPGEYVGD